MRIHQKDINLLTPVPLAPNFPFAHNKPQLFHLLPKDFLTFFLVLSLHERLFGDYLRLEKVDEGEIVGVLGTNLQQVFVGLFPVDVQEQAYEEGC
jgi:hypothetical protein